MLAAAFSDRFKDFGRTTSTPPPTWLPAPLFDRYVAAFDASGFASGLAHYRSIDANWGRDVAFSSHATACPSLSVSRSSDPVRRSMRPDIDRTLHDDLEILVVERAGARVAE